MNHIYNVKCCIIEFFIIQGTYLTVVNLCCCRDPQLVKKIGAITAQEVRATGVAQVFAPCVAVNKWITYNRNIDI